MTTQHSIFDLIGFKVKSLTNGVYQLTNSGVLSQDYVALLYSEQPVAPPRATLKLFMCPLPEGLAPERIITHWQNLDARRLEESGLYFMKLELGGQALPGAHAQNYVRPDERVRAGVMLSSGDYICYN